MKPKLSIVYVYYNTPFEMKSSINSLDRSLEGIENEVIIVDNASNKSLPKDILKIRNIKIIRNVKNCGYGKALNQGAGKALGKYLLFVNSDVEFIANSIKHLLDRIENDSRIGIIGPQLINKKGETLQSLSGMPYLPKVLFVFSFLAKIWPNNPFLRKYHNLDLDRNKEHEVDVVGGACMLVRKLAFDKISGFDERFFLYFEEADFCFRIKKAGYKILYYPQAKIIHLVGKSTQDKEWIKKTFEQSRFRFFQKYHGLMPALVGELFLRFFKPTNILLLAILVLSAFLNFYKLSEGMIFIGDQGWFYLSARDMLLTGKIPLVGITASHTWLHQGPIWTYILAIIFWIFNYNPVAPAYFTAFLNVVTVWFIYQTGKTLFSKSFGLIAVVLYSVSPLVVISARMPYHTSLIPLLSLFFVFCLCRWIKGGKYFFPCTILTLSLLYNFELATQVLWFVLLTVFIFGAMKKAEWIKILLDKKIIALSLLSLIIPILPVLIYDYSHGFLQTLGFMTWIGYKVFKFIPDLIKQVGIKTDFLHMFRFYAVNYGRLSFPLNPLVQLTILIFSFGSFFLSIYKQLKGNNVNSSYILLGLWIFIPILVFFLNRTPSDAYLPLLFPSIIFLTALFFDRLIIRFYFLKYLFMVILALLVVLNFSYIINKNYLIEKSYGGLPFSKRLEAAKLIVGKASGKKYNIIPKGNGAQFESYTMNYQYLTWWLGNAPSKKPENVKFTLEEKQDRIIVEKELN